jgi:hypothetical protein
MDQYELGDWETDGATMSFAATSTFTFYEGTPPIDALRARVHQLVQGHPWLAGRIQTIDGEVKLTPTDPEAWASYFEVIEGPPLAANMPYEAILEVARSKLIKPGSACLDADEALFRVVMFTHDSGFALLTSLSHVLADGFTFYYVYGQLSCPTEPASMSTARQHAFGGDVLSEALGPEKASWLGTGDAFQSMVHSWSHPLDCAVFELNTPWVAEQKVQYSSEDSFVSTNDVLTSWFFQQGEFFKYGLMAINCRQRLCELTLSHIGNYEAFVQYFPDESSTPQGIRKALLSPPKFAAGRTDVPTPEETRTLHWACSTNWVTFYQHVTFGGCTHLFHIPLYDLDMPLPGAMVIFRPNEGQIAVLSMVRSKEHQECLLKSDAVSGLLLPRNKP